MLSPDNGNDGVQILNRHANSNVVAGNKIGTDVSGNVALGNTSWGVEVDAGCIGNTIGGTAAGCWQRDLGQWIFGVWITGQARPGNLVQDNLIGTDITGTIALANKQGGVQVEGAGNNTVENNLIGGLTHRRRVFYGFNFASAPSAVDLTLQGDLSGPPHRQTSGRPDHGLPYRCWRGRVLLAIVHPEGFTARVMILDSQGRVLVQSDGLSPSDPDPVIDQYLAVGNYSLVVESTGGAGAYALTTTLAQASAPFQPIPVGSHPDAIVAGDFNGDGRTRPGRRKLGRQHRVGIAGQRRRHVSAPGHLRGGRAARRDRGGGLHRRRPHSTWPSQTQMTTPCRCCMGNGDGTFQPQVTYAVGSFPVAIVAGDFNGDGRTDLAVVNEGNYPNYDDTVSVLLGNGDGTFQPQVTYAVGMGPDAIVAGDFNGDGRTDLAVANAVDGTVSVLLGNGDGTFQPQVTYAVGVNPTASWRATSKATAAPTWPCGQAYPSRSPTGEVSVLLGNGDGTFQPQVTYAVGLSPIAIVAGDFTGDGRTDLAVVNALTLATGTVSVLLGNGDGTFQPRSPTQVGLAARRDRGGRLQRRRPHRPRRHGSDSRPSANGECRCCWAMATARSSPRSTYAVGSEPHAIVAGDFNGDGRTDLAIANNGDNTVSVLLGNGDGTFQPQVTYAVGSDPDAIVAGDFNGDGRTDLAVANSHDSTVSVLLGNGDGTFQPQVTYAVGEVPRRSWRVTSTATAAPTWPSQTIRRQHRVGAAGQRRRHVPAPGHLRGGVGAPGDRGGRLQRRRPHRPRRRKRVTTAPCRCCWATATARSSPRPPTRWGFPRGDRGGRLHRRRPHRPRRREPGHSFRRQRDPRHSTVSVLLGNGDGTFQPQVTYAVGSYPSASLRVASTATAAPTWPLWTDNAIELLVGNGDGTFQPAINGRVGNQRLSSGRRLQRRRPHSTWPSYTGLTTLCRCCWAAATARSPLPDSSSPRLMPRPLVADVNGDGTTMSWSSTVPGISSTARASPGSLALSTRQSPSTPAIRRATSPGLRIRASFRSSPASMLTITRSRFTSTATVAS